MPTSSFPRLAAAAFGVAAVLGVVGSLVAFNGLLFALSFVGAIAAIVVPQYIVFSIISKSADRNRDDATAPRPFYFWSVKFSLSILLMAVVLRGLQESGLLQAPSFIAGIVIGVLFNIFWAARSPLTTSTAQVKDVNHGE